MKQLSLFVLVFLISGCAGIGSSRYHSLHNADNYLDCGAAAGEPRMGSLKRLSGPGNSKSITVKGHDLLICSRTSGEDSLYLFGPLIPVIPMFGLGPKEQPEFSKFTFINRSENMQSVIVSEEVFESCSKPLKEISGVAFSCETYVLGSRITVEAKEVLYIRSKFKTKHRFSLQLSENNQVDFVFNYDSGMYFIFTG